MEASPSGCPRPPVAPPPLVLPASSARPLSVTSVGLVLPGAALHCTPPSTSGTGAFLLVVA